jgi:hypothetical protein
MSHYHPGLKLNDSNNSFAPKRSVAGDRLDCLRLPRGRAAGSDCSTCSAQPVRSQWAATLSGTSPVWPGRNTLPSWLTWNGARALIVVMMSAVR